MTQPDSQRWPVIPVADWEDTRDTLHLWTQVVGKIRLANAPLVNHWWNVPLYVTARGLTTSLMPTRPGRGFEIDFDFCAHRLDIATVDGAGRSIPLEPPGRRLLRTTLMAMLDDLGLDHEIWPVPVEIAAPSRSTTTATTRPTTPTPSSGSGGRSFEIDRVFDVFRAGSSASPARCTCSGGRSTSPTPGSPGSAAPPHPGGAPNCGPHVMREAYSHEVSSSGYWPGPPGDEGVFYAYAYPEPPGYRDTQ